MSYRQPRRHKEGQASCLNPSLHVNFQHPHCFTPTIGSIPGRQVQPTLASSHLSSQVSTLISSMPFSSRALTLPTLGRKSHCREQSYQCPNLKFKYTWKKTRLPLQPPLCLPCHTRDLATARHMGRKTLPSAAHRSLGEANTHRELECLCHNSRKPCVTAGEQEGHQTRWDRSGVRKRFQEIWLVSESSRRWLSQPGLGEGPGKTHQGRPRHEITPPVWEHCMA